MESLRILGILLYKSWLVRKRQWITSLIVEILLPLATISLPYTLFGEAIGPPVFTPDEHFQKRSLDEVIDKSDFQRIAYVPSHNSFIEQLMKEFSECYGNKTEMHPFASEADFIEAYRNTSRYGYRWALIFDETTGWATKKFHYKLRGDFWAGNDLYNEYEHIDLFNYFTNSTRLLQTQICIDRSIIAVKNDTKRIPETFVQRIPYPAHFYQYSWEQYLRWTYSVFLAVAFMFPLLVETARATNEKFAGMNVSMSMNGIPNTLNLLSWTIGGWLLLSVFCVIPTMITLVTSHEGGIPYVNHGDPLILFFALAFYTAHALTFGVHLSAYFSKALLVTFVILILSVVPIVLMIFVLKDHLGLVPFVGILLPNVLLYQMVQEFRSYEVAGKGLGWGNLFTTADSSTGISGGMGLILILFIIGTILHFLLAIYMYAIKPGKYGVGEHPLFFLMLKWKRTEKTYFNAADLVYDGRLDACFEPTNPGAYKSGIQIRNLKKAYNISLFSKEKVHALRGVSVDFYKGQITSLLGHNGAGKTTLMSILTGMVSPTDGLVLINSKNLKENASEIMNDMGLCTQQDMYFSSLTVSEQLLFFAMVKRKDKSRSEIRRDVNNLLDKLKLFDKRNALPSTLSGGQKRRLCLGMALVGDSSILILDEPTSGLDPESRRVIWDILLKMRGQKTILISTHDMEEADILGDRIAIMHTGQLKSYGTSFFLKKMIGQNNVEVTLSIEPHSDPDRIRRELHSDGIIVNKEASKMVVSIPNSDELPDRLDNLEEKKKKIGVSGFSVSLISLEQVFLKMTYDGDGPQRSRCAVTSNETKLKGCTLFLQTVKALLSKKMVYALKDYSTILIEVFTIFMALLTISVILKASTSFSKNTSEEVMHIELDKYESPEVLYTSQNKSIGDLYKSVSDKLGGKTAEISNSNLENELLRRGKEDVKHYDKYLLAAAEFNETANGRIANAFYSQKAMFSLPISINLLWNTIIQNILGPDHSISLSTQGLPDRWTFGGNEFLTYLNGFMTALIFAILLNYVVAMFAIHPLRESVTGVKQLQKMTGISGFTYWGTTFLFDLIMFLILIVLVVGGFACMDRSLGLRLYGSREIGIMVLLLFLFALNALPFIYIFSFIKMKTNSVIRLLTYVPIGIVILDLSLTLGAFLHKSVDKFRSVQKGIFLLLPYESFLHTQITFQMTAQINARCRTLPNDYYDSQCTLTDPCCAMGCYNGTCKEYKNFFDYHFENISSKDSMIYMYIMPIVYFIILGLLEMQLIQKIKAKFTEDFVEETNADEQVRREKLTIGQEIRAFGGNVLETHYANTDNIINGRSSFQVEYSPGISGDHVFQVYELQKSYKNVKAVRDVSFSVNRRECFGLLGVNGAGKSTTFRMMTGGEVPDHGVMYIGDKDFENNEKYYLSQMGYCPQHDAILKCLNSYDHLRLFARLRGIPENQVENEVKAWIERLNLSACALQPSGTYSGGNKRRLNIAIALIGNPNLVLMDEPTTGVDPGARRSLWNVIKACQMAGQAVVLTSHSMEECEALCDRLAIMVDGKLVCIGASEQLKQRFGAGYDIQIKLNLAKAQTQLNSIKSDMPSMLNCVLTDENLGNLMYHVAPTGTTWRKMYDVMNGMKNRYDCIDDFLVLSSSLEQLFLLFARTANGSLRLS